MANRRVHALFIALALLSVVAFQVSANSQELDSEGMLKNTAGKTADFLQDFLKLDNRNSAMTDSVTKSV
jgi:hypothetical protein